MAFDSLTQKGSMGFNSGAPKQQYPGTYEHATQKGGNHPLTQGHPWPVMVPDKPVSAPVDPIQRVTEIGARPPLGPIKED